MTGPRLIARLLEEVAHLIPNKWLREALDYFLELFAIALSAGWPLWLTLLIIGALLLLRRLFLH